MPYTFSAEDFSKFMNDVLKANGDQATLTSLLSDMQGTVSDAIISSQQDKADVERITTENNRLREANFNYFNQIGEFNKNRASTEKPKADPDPDESEESGTEEYMASYFKRLDDKK